MSNADRLRSGPGLPSSARLVDRAAEQRVPFTSPHPSLAQNGQWIRSDTRRYTLKGAAHRDLNFIPPTAIAPSTSKTTHVPVKVLRHTKKTHRLQKSLFPGRRRATSRPSERPDVPVRRQHPPNPGPIRPGRVQPTRALLLSPTSTSYTP